MKKFLLVFLILGIFISSFATVQLPREETVYVTGALWGPATTWNLFAAQSTWGTDQFLYVPLYHYNIQKDAWLPWLAESYEFINPTTLRVKIRDEARWSDGIPITADDLVFTWNLTKKLGLGPNAGWNTYIKEIVAIDSKTIEFRANEENMNYFNFLSNALGAKPMPKHVFEPLANEGKVGDFINDKNQVVSGPYKLYHSDTNIISYQRIDDWWGKDIFGLPGPKYIAHVIYKDNAAAALAFEREDADWSSLFIPKVEDLWQKKKLPVGTWKSELPYFTPDGLAFLYINNTKPLLNDINVKKAIAYAIPYKEMLAKAYFGYGEQAHPSMVMDVVESYRKWIDYDLAKKTWGTKDGKIKTDLKKAEKILDEAGFKKGKDGIRVDKNGNKLGTFTISVPYGWTDWMMMCEMIAKNLRSIGIDVQTEFPDFSVWADRMTKGTFDLIISWSVGAGFDHPYNIYRFVLDPRLSKPVGEVTWAGDWERYQNPEVVELLDKTVSTLDPEERKQAYFRLQKLVYRDLPSIPIFYNAHWYEYSTKYWKNWPNENNPTWYPGGPQGSTALAVTFSINKGESTTNENMFKTLNNGGFLVPTSKVFDDLQNAAK
ncbi:MAG: peptide ABC transporter substrate-binding protein [Marinitoga sp. 4572_148]|nr:MAG: peptide ABC transporter substrate-binding protein [Marinitoga sp. 4572_148]